MRLLRGSRRPLAVLLSGTLLLAACSPPPSVYSRDPVDPDGKPLREYELVGLELKDHTRHELELGETLNIESGVLVIRSRTREDGSRRQRVFDLDELELLEVRTPDGRETWYEVATPVDLAASDTLPRIEEIQLLDGETIDVDRTMRTRWSASRLELLVGPDGATQEELRVVPLDEVHSVRVAQTSALKSTVLSPRFWIVAGAAVVLAWFVAGQEDSDNTAVE